MPKATYIAQHQIRGLKRPKTVDGSQVEHVLNAGEEITLDAEHEETVRLVAHGVLVKKAGEPVAEATE